MMTIAPLLWDHLENASMPNEIKAKTMAEIPMQRAPQAGSPAQARGRYFNSANAFNLILPPVPDAVFTDEPASALAADASTGYTTCDLAGDMQKPSPATTPLLLARYARVNAGEILDAHFDTTGSIWYVIQGEGTVTLDRQEIAWWQSVHGECHSRRDIAAPHLLFGGENQRNAGHIFASVHGI